MTDTPTDWRGAPIHPGYTVIYGAGVGRSVDLVEATVLPHPENPYGPHLTGDGQVWLRVIRRSYHTPDTDRVRVGVDRLTVVTGLPLTIVPTAQEKITERAHDRITDHTKAIVQAEALPEWPTHNPNGSPNWTREQCIAYHQKEIKAAQRKLTRMEQDPA